MLSRQLLEEISRSHFPYPPASPRELAEFEHRVGWTLDPSLRAFYLHCNGAELFERLPEAPYQILPLSKVTRARVAMGRRDTDEAGPSSWFALCDVQDGDYILLDVSTRQAGHYPLIDGWHEGFPDPQQCRRIASSFAEFLERALGSGGRHFWLDRP